jgi:hypothetical protein
MKKSPPTNSFFPRMTLLFTCFMLSALCNRPSAAGLPLIHETTNRVEVNFKHDLVNNQLTIRVRSALETVMQLYIFTPDGILIKEVDISAIKITTIPGLKKGYYFYECFDNDERMKRGTLIIK